MSARRYVMGGLLSLACAACSDVDQRKVGPLLEEVRPGNACFVFCTRLPEVCPEVAEELERLESEDGIACRERCLKGDEPDGGTQNVDYLECLADANSCDELAECKQAF